MPTQSVKFIKRSLLSLGITAAIILAPHHPTLSQVAPPQPYSPSLTLTQSLSPQAVVQAVGSVGMTVSDMDEAIAFYSQVLSFQKISDVEVWGSEYERLEGVFGVRMRVVQMQLGEEVIELTDYLTPGGQPIPTDSRSNDHWFQHIAIVVRDMEQAYQRLRDHQVQYVSTAPQRLPESIPAAAGIEAFYFRDPDGHNLEIIYYPPGKGDPRWQEPTNQLFLGIDHTAIAVSDTETSFRFYRDLLGLTLAGTSENYGTEQEHLNNVSGARLRISGLRAAAGPGIEFLEYLMPRDGRAFPSDAESHDLVNWQTTLIVEDLNAVAQRLQEAGHTFVSSGVVDMPGRLLGFSKGLLVRDPDGHVMRIVER